MKNLFLPFAISRAIALPLVALWLVPNLPAQTPAAEV